MIIFIKIYLKQSNTIDKKTPKCFLINFFLKLEQWRTSDVNNKMTPKENARKKHNKLINKRPSEQNSV